MSNLFVLTGQEEHKDPHGWEGMPEFVQEEQKEFHMIKVRFRNEQDVLDFAKAIGQPHITMRSKFTWYPALDRGANTLNRWMGDTAHED